MKCIILPRLELHKFARLLVSICMKRNENEIDSSEVK